jgi:hypothetical protein
VRVGEYARPGRSGDNGRRYGTYEGEPSDGGGMFGAVSSTEGVLDNDPEVTVGLYVRVGDCLRV